MKIIKIKDCGNCFYSGSNKTDTDIYCYHPETKLISVKSYVKDKALPDGDNCPLEEIAGDIK